MAVYQEALDAYANPFQEFSVKKLTGGLINRSYKVTSKLTGVAFLLQQVNQHVFPEAGDLQNNYELLWKYLQSEKNNFIMPEPGYFVDNSTLFCDSNNNQWRVFEYLAGTTGFPAPENASQAKAVARIFAGFTAGFRDFNITQLQIVIPHFHDLSFRFRQFEESIRKRHYARLEKASAVIAGLKKRERYTNFYDILTESDEFPQRVMHHDAKITNVLFDEETATVVCPVDFDTTMPGYFFSDLGDMIRSMAGSQDENSSDFELLSIRKDFYESIVSGYLEIMKEQLTGSEIKYIHAAGLIMTYMQALRFITDYLEEDCYYQITYPEQNLGRAKNQLILLEKLETFLEMEYNFRL
jgi:Ser/Thr protein kinase RdoA (MazF antagonist)